jgi:hypothetical protein
MTVLTLQSSQHVDTKQWFEPCQTQIYRVRHKSVNTPLSHERLVVRTRLAVYSGWG